jgi:hypothetical protein
MNAEQNIPCLVFGQVALICRRESPVHDGATCQLVLKLPQYFTGSIQEAVAQALLPFHNVNIQLTVVPPAAGPSGSPNPHFYMETTKGNGSDTVMIARRMIIDPSLLLLREVEVVRHLQIVLYYFGFRGTFKIQGRIRNQADGLQVNVREVGEFVITPHGVVFDYKQILIPNGRFVPELIP